MKFNLNQHTWVLSHAIHLSSAKRLKIVIAWITS